MLKAIKKLMKKGGVLPALVEIRGETITGQSSGSGFGVTPDGKIVTCLHVIKDLKLGSVRLSSGEIFDIFPVLKASCRSVAELENDVRGLYRRIQ